jgi:hypothetical protein
MRRTLLALSALLLVTSLPACSTTNPRFVKKAQISQTLMVSGSILRVEMADERLLAKQQLWLDWVQQGAQIVSQYYARFPVKEVNIILYPFDGEGVKTGRAVPGVTPEITVLVGVNSTADQLRTDWIMVHEMVHLALPYVQREHRWLSEGLAVYVESIARAEAGAISKKRVRTQFIRRMPQGQPQEGDQGLDGNTRWGRVYWGGAIFALIADNRIREETDSKKSLKEVLRALVDDGMTFEQSLDIESIFIHADNTIGKSIIMPLYEEYKDSGKAFDLRFLHNKEAIKFQ